MDWERVWNHSVASDALPASLSELRCVSTTPTALTVGHSENSDQTGGRAYDRHSNGQRSSRSQPGVVIVICPCDPGWYPSIGSVKESHIPKLGLFASSTPFVTGRPYTLIFNGSVKSSGAVGLALSGGSRPLAETAFPGLRAITGPLKVTQYVLSISPHSFINIRNLDQKAT